MQIQAKRQSIIIKKIKKKKKDENIYCKFIIKIEKNDNHKYQIENILLTLLKFYRKQHTR